MKINVITRCGECKYLRWDGKLAEYVCAASKTEEDNQRKIQMKFLSKFPDWCPLKDIDVEGDVQVKELLKAGVSK